MDLIMSYDVEGSDLDDGAPEPDTGVTPSSAIQHRRASPRKTQIESTNTTPYLDQSQTSTANRRRSGRFVAKVIRFGVVEEESGLKRKLDVEEKKEDSSETSSSKSASDFSDSDDASSPASKRPKQSESPPQQAILSNKKKKTKRDRFLIAGQIDTYRQRKSRDTLPPDTEAKKREKELHDDLAYLDRYFETDDEMRARKRKFKRRPKKRVKKPKKEKPPKKIKIPKVKVLKQFKCYLCGVMNTRKTLGAHYRQFHLEDGLYRCTKCDASATVFINIVEHYRTVHEGIFYTCEKCGRQFSYRRHFQSHQKGKCKQQILELKNQCKKCNRFFETPNALAKHHHLHQRAELSDEQNLLQQERESLLKSLAEGPIDDDEEIPLPDDDVRSDDSSSSASGDSSDDKSSDSQRESESSSDESSAAEGEGGEESLPVSEPRRSTRASNVRTRRLSSSSSSSEEAGSNLETPVKRNKTPKGDTKPILDHDLNCTTDECSASTKLEPRTPGKKKTPKKDKNKTPNKDWRFRCALCVEEFQTIRLISNHYKKEHMTSNGKFKCPQCSKLFNQRSSIARHFQAVHKTRTYRCVRCGMVFTYRDSLMKHDRERDTKCKPLSPTTARLTCEYCGRRFTRQQALGSHLNYHIAKGEAPPKTPQSTPAQPAEVIVDESVSSSCLQQSTSTCDSYDLALEKLEPVEPPEVLVPSRASTPLEHAE